MILQKRSTQNSSPAIRSCRNRLFCGGRRLWHLSVHSGLDSIDSKCQRVQVSFCQPSPYSAIGPWRVGESISTPGCLREQKNEADEWRFCASLGLLVLVVPRNENKGMGGNMGVARFQTQPNVVRRIQIWHLRPLGSLLRPSIWI